MKPRVVDIHTVGYVWYEGWRGVKWSEYTSGVGGWLKKNSEKTEKDGMAEAIRNTKEHESPSLQTMRLSPLGYPRG